MEVTRLHPGHTSSARLSDQDAQARWHFRCRGTAWAAILTNFLAGMRQRVMIAMAPLPCDLGIADRRRTDDRSRRDHPGPDP